MKNIPSKNPRAYGGVEAGLRTENRRAALVEAGLEAFGTVGFAKSSIKDICGLAGLTQRYFYESFKKKEDLLSAVYGQVVNGVLETGWANVEKPAKTPAQAVTRTLRTYYQDLLDDPRKARILYFEILGVSGRIDQEYQAATKRLVDLIAHALSRAFPALSAEQLQRTIVPTGLAGAVNLIAANWALDSYATPLEDILLQVQALAQLLDGFLKTSPEGVPA
ncbi:MAG: TetR/AcrR family transcriptional regulator [Proteobacteria bacterium]|nr:TetR/AcrR family transcriptional regulator [Pseudomonadota bacterium]